MATAVKKTISLPADLARDTEALARAEGKTLSAVIQEALHQARIERRLREFPKSSRTSQCFSRTLPITSSRAGDRRS